MREIKFRAWHKDDHEMIHFDLLHINYWDGQVDTGWVEYDGETRGSVWSNVQEGTVMQYTGLYDHKSNAEVYENDIVRTPYGIGIVVWDREGCDYNVVKHLDLPHEGQNLVCSFGLNGTDYEVMGNIYENPELIKDGTPNH